MTEVTEIAPCFQTSDGGEFATKAEAMRHQVVLDAMEALDVAQRRFEVALAEECLTADGLPFRFDNTDYYWLAHRHPGLCTLRRIWFYRYSVRVEHGFPTAGPTILMTEDAGDGKQKSFRIAISKLYASEKAGKEALLVEQEQELRWMHEAHAALRADVEKERGK